MTISEVSARFALSPDTLRYYERVGLISGVCRTKSGVRNYTEENCGWIEFIKCMRSAGLPIGVLIEYMKLVQQGDGSAGAREKLLVEQREQLLKKMNEMQETLDRLNYKIAICRQKAVPAGCSVSPKRPEEE